MKVPLVSQILKYALYAAFLIGALGVVTLPFLLDSYLMLLRDAYSVSPHYHAFILTFLILVALPGLWVIVEMIGMLRSIPGGPFVTRNVRALRRIGVILLALAAVFVVKCLVYVTPLTIACGALLVIGGLFAFTLAALIRQAVVFREENDLTI